MNTARLLSKPPQAFNALMTKSTFSFQIRIWGCVQISGFLLMTSLAFPLHASNSHSLHAEFNLLTQYTASSSNSNEAPSQQTWLSGGLGRYNLGEEHDKLSSLADIQLAYSYQPSSSITFFTHLQLSDSLASDSARHIGLVELKARYHKDLNFNQSIRVTVGQFFLPISMENTERFWETPYTLSFSSLNSWIGEEFRPIGVDLSYQYHFDNGIDWETAITAFGGNDSMGAILAYRGWSYGRHRTAFGDVLDLPDLASLNDGGAFERQRDDGSKPFGRDLDNRPGYAIRSAITGDNYLISFAWIDNLGDTELHHGEYAWRTQFAIIGASWLVSDEWELISEFSAGNTTMGEAPGVDANFYTGYLMTSYTRNDVRFSLRLDVFGMNDKDAIDQDNNDLGRSTTLAIRWQPEDTPFEVGSEILYLNSKRTKALSSGSFEEPDSWQTTFHLKYRF